jgi:4-cresol dehydrogenase (hydroxylating)
MAEPPAFGADSDSPDETQRALELRAELAELTARAGYPQYRTTVAFADSILAPAPAFQRLCDSIKAGVDPANILAPGRYGIGLRR